MKIKLLSVFFTVAMLVLGTNVWAEKNCQAVSGTSDVQFTPAPWTPGTQVASGTITLETTKKGGGSWSGDATLILLQLIPVADGSMQMLVRFDFDFAIGGSLSMVAYAVLTPSAVPGEYSINERAMVIGGTGDFENAFGDGTAAGTASLITGMAHVNVMGTICTP